jgi:hypothetical protein
MQSVEVCVLDWSERSDLKLIVYHAYCSKFQASRCDRNGERSPTLGGPGVFDGKSNERSAEKSFVPKRASTLGIFAL